MDTHGEKTGIFAKKELWIGIGIGIFVLIAFILPTPQSLIEVMEKYGYVEKMIEWEIADNAKEASNKTMIVLGLVPMAVVFSWVYNRTGGNLFVCALLHASILATVETFERALPVLWGSGVERAMLWAGVAAALLLIAATNGRLGRPGPPT